jgi:hypothetical protein
MKLERANSKVRNRGCKKKKGKRCIRKTPADVEGIKIFRVTEGRKMEGRREKEGKIEAPPKRGIGR